MKKSLAAGGTVLLFLCLSCGGGGTSVRGGLDPETGAVTGESEDAPVRARTRKAKTIRPADIPLLSLDGLLPETPPESAAQAEAGVQQPDSKFQGPPVPPGLAQQGGASPGPPKAGSQAQPPPAPEQPGTKGGPAPAPPRPDAQAQAEIVLPPRNLFGIEEDPAVVAERQRKAQEAAQKAAEAAEKAVEARRRWQGPPQPPPPPQPPQITFQFIGYLGPPGDRTGVFSQGGQVIMAKKSESILGQFKIVDIGYESAEIGFTGFKETQRIPLSGGGK